MSLEKSHFVDQRSRAVADFITVHAERLAKQGSIVAKWRRRDGHWLGPYYFLASRDAAGRQRAVYLGRRGAVVASVSKRLDSLQRPRRQRRAIEAARKLLRRGLAAAKRQLDVELAKVGLRRHGHEVRGWASRRGSAGPSTSIPARRAAEAVIENRPPRSK
jgi:hypothetical protein